MTPETPDRPSRPPDDATVAIIRSDPDERIPIVPLPVPRGWILVPIRWVRDITVIFLGALTFISQLYGYSFQKREPNVALLVAACALLGVVLPGFWMGDRHNNRGH